MPSKLGWWIIYFGPTESINKKQGIPHKQDRTLSLMFVHVCEGGVGGGSPLANCFQRVLRAGVEILWNSFSSRIVCVALACPWHGGWALVKKNARCESQPRAPNYEGNNGWQLYHFDPSRPQFLSLNYKARVTIHTKAKITTMTKPAQTHPVLAASEARICCWKRTVATVQLEELFQGTGNTLAVNELFFARMSDSSCAPVNSLLLPWEIKPAPSEELKEVSQGSPVGAAPSGARATGVWPINHRSPKFIIPALSVYLGHAQRSTEGPRKITVPAVTLLISRNCPLLRFPHWQHHGMWNWASLHWFFLTELNLFPLLLFLSSCQEITMCIIFYPFPSWPLAPAPNKPLHPWGCLLGTLFSKHKSLGRILLEQVSRKSVAQARHSSPVDKDASLKRGEVEERKGKGSLCPSLPCPFPSPASLSHLHWVSGARTSQGNLAEQTCAWRGLIMHLPTHSDTWATENQSCLMPGCCGYWVSSCLPSATETQGLCP